MAVVYIIRHGETPYNVMEILTGRGSDPELTEIGIAQANRAARHLHENYVDHIELIVSSNMTRTNQTAEIINQLLQKPMLYDKAIQEIDRGGFEGHSKDYVLPIINALQPHESHPIHGGESLNNFQERTTLAMCEYFKMSEKAILLVSHGFVIEKVLEFFTEDQVQAHNAHVFTLNPEEIDLAGKCRTDEQNSSNSEEL